MQLHAMQGMAATRAGGIAEPAAMPSPRLVKAAHEFEGQLMEQLLKPMTDSDGLTGDSVSGSAGALGSFAAAALGRALSAEGGLGLANQIIRELSPRAGEKVSASGTESQGQGPGVTNLGNRSLSMSDNK
ncbi:MAG TPA: hypothetical protein VGR64_08200 [Terracidiphilus sp.]|nr:hypothetical protein [Terracidiphilus sp.]